MLKILNKVFKNQNGGGLIVDLFNRLVDFFSKVFSAISDSFSFFIVGYKKTNSNSSSFNKISFSVIFQVVIFYHSSPKEWITVPMPPFLK